MIPNSFTLSAETIKEKSIGSQTKMFAKLKKKQSYLKQTSEQTKSFKDSNYWKSFKVVFKV